MNKQQTVQQIKEMFEKMLPVFVGSWSDEKHLKDFSFKTYQNANSTYGSIDITKESKIHFTYSNGNIDITQELGKELSLEELHGLIEKIFKATFSYESLSSEEYKAIERIRNIKREIHNQEKEIKTLEKNLEVIQALNSKKII